MINLMVWEATHRDPVAIEDSAMVRYAADTRKQLSSPSNARRPRSSSPVIATAERRAKFSSFSSEAEPSDFGKTPFTKHTGRRPPLTAHPNPPRRPAVQRIKTARSSTGKFQFSGLSSGHGRKRPQATAGDRRRPQATAGDRRRPQATAGNRMRPSASAAKTRAGSITLD